MAKRNNWLSDLAANLGAGKTNAERDAERYLEGIRTPYEDLVTPDLIELDPYFAENFDLAPTELGNVSTDPMLREAQLEQLAALRGIAGRGGRDASTDAELARIQGLENQNERGNREAILQNARARGLGGSGLELMAQLGSAQNSQNAQSARDMEVAALQSKNAMASRLGAANMAAGMENTDYSRQAAKAQAADEINRFNTTQRNALGLYNTGLKNAALEHKSGLGQQAFNNQLAKAQGISGANRAGMDYYQKQNSIGSQRAGNLLSSAGQFAGAYMNMPKKKNEGVE